MRSSPLYLVLALASFAVALPQGSDTTRTGIDTPGTGTDITDTGNNNTAIDTAHPTMDGADATLPHTTEDGSTASGDTGTGTGASAPLGTGSSTMTTLKSGKSRQGPGMPLLPMEHRRQHNNTHLTPEVKAAIDTILAAYPKVAAAKGPKFMDVVVDTDKIGEPVYHLGAFALPPLLEHSRNNTASHHPSGTQPGSQNKLAGAAAASGVVPGVAGASAGATIADTSTDMLAASDSQMR